MRSAITTGTGLVANGPMLDGYRAIFGDEREDYAEALQRHYSNSAPAGWQMTHVSSYACAHSWEDFAETWAPLFSYCRRTGDGWMVRA